MDPNATLRTITHLAEQAIRNSEEGFAPILGDNDTRELAEGVVALDVWIQEGGFLPSLWAED